MRFAVALLVAIIVAQLPACGGSGGPASTRKTPRASVFGVVGASISRFALEGYNRLGGTRGWPDEALVEYGGGDISKWAGGVGVPGSLYWDTFLTTLATEPGTDQIWWQIVVSGRSEPRPVALTAADRQMVRSVAREIARLTGPETRILVSPMPRYGSGTGCEQAGPTDFDLAELMTDYAVAQGLAERGPTLAPITTRNYNGPNDPCHQGSNGREQHGRTLRSVFGG